MSKTRTVLDRLRAYESRNVTFLDPDGQWPIVWDRARGVRVWDVEGRQYLDLTAAFGVAAAGHANPRVVAAGRRQMGRLLHAMGDVHPHALKAELARELSRLTFERWTRTGREPASPSQISNLKSQISKGSPRASACATRISASDRAPSAATTGKVIFCNSGFEAVEAALKTALLATGRPEVIAFTGAYHGLGYGALTATHRAYFRAPFRAQLRQFAHFVPFPDAEAPAAQTADRVHARLRTGRIAAVLIETVQGRGGIRIAPPEFLRELRHLCDQAQALLIIDEIYTGFGRTGRWFGCEHSGVIPDVVCLGKALTGGFPLSACVGRAALMDAAWPASTGEAIHTSTFLGHPVGCAMALAQIREIERQHLVERSAVAGQALLEGLRGISPPRRFRTLARGLGLMAGLEVREAGGSAATTLALGVVQAMLRRGFLCLPEGDQSQVIGFTPPLTITAAQLRRSVAALQASLTEAARA